MKHPDLSPLQAHALAIEWGHLTREQSYDISSWCATHKYWDIEPAVAELRCRARIASRYALLALDGAGRVSGDPVGPGA